MKRSEIKIQPQCRILYPDRHVLVRTHSLYFANQKKKLFIQVKLKGEECNQTESASCGLNALILWKFHPFYTRRVCHAECVLFVVASGACGKRKQDPIFMMRR